MTLTLFSSSHRTAEKNHFDIILEVKSTNTHERSTVNAEFKDGRQKRMTNAIFVTLSHEDSHVKIRVL